MMSSVDGRIDCKMLENMPGDEYFSTLSSFHGDGFISGRNTAELEMALPGRFEGKTRDVKEDFFSKKTDRKGFDIVIDTNGVLRYAKRSLQDAPLLIVTSRKVTREYLEYLDKENISYIVCGEEHVDLKKACQILLEEFHLERLCVVGGPYINGAFLKAGLLDEVSIVIGSGIDGRSGWEGVFEGADETHGIYRLITTHVEWFKKSGAVWIIYRLD